MLSSLINAISKTVILNQADKELCSQFFEPLFFTKNTVLEEQDKIPQYLYFINSGFMRLFYYDDNGDEATTYIRSNDGFIAPFLSLINERKAKENVECVTDCNVLRILRANLLELIDRSENFKKFSLIIFEQAIASTEIRANDLATLNAEQRYRKLINEHPEILQNVPIQYIASFLGMKPESLSRIRRQMSRV